MSWTRLYQILGRFHLVGLIIPELKDHMTCYKFERFIGGKFNCKKNTLNDLLSSLIAVISTNESTQFITGRMVYNLPYT